MLVALAVGLVVVMMTIVINFLRRKLYHGGRHETIVEGIPVVPDPHWLLGHQKQYTGFDLCASRPHFTFNHANEEGLCSFWKISVPFVSVTTPKHARTILHASADRHPSFTLEHHLRHFLGPRNIFMMNGREWKFYRSVVHKAFSPSVLDAIISKIISVGFALVQSLQHRIDNADDSSITVEVFPLIKMVAIDIFGAVTMGTNFQGCATLELSPIAKAIDFMSDELSRRASSPLNPFDRFYYLPSTPNSRHRKERCFLRSLLNSVIDSRRMEIAVNNDSEGIETDLLSHLLRAFEVEKANSETKGENLSDSSFTDLFLSLFFAGYETTSVAVTYALYCIAKHPEVEGRCLRELKSVLGRPGNKSSDSNHMDVPSFDPKKLVYCRAVILETLRLYPPVTTLSRYLQKPVRVGSTELPKGIRVFLHLWSIQRDQRNFPRPLEFIPERWAVRHGSNTNCGVSGDVWVERLPDQNYNEEKKNFSGIDIKEVATEKNNKNDYIPPGDPGALFAFSSGARICAGRKLAIQETVIILAVMLQNLKFELVSPQYKVKPCVSGLVQIPSDNLPMIIRRRWK